MEREDSPLPRQSLPYHLTLFRLGSSVEIWIRFFVLTPRIPVSDAQGSANAAERMDARECPWKL